MDLSVVVVSFNTRTLLERCLQSITVRVRGLRYEVVVVDNASADGSAEMVAERFGDAILVRNATNRGFAAAVNQGIAASTGRHVLLLNSDATLVEESAQKMVAHLDNHPQTGAIGGMLLNADGGFQGSYAEFPTLITETLLLTGLSRWLLPPTFPSRSADESQEPRNVDWVCGAFLMLRRAALDDIGSLDERYFMYAEEVDWCYRARQAGWLVAYLPDARAVHLVAGSYSSNAGRRRQHMYRSKSLYFQKHKSRIEAAIFHNVVRIASCLKLAAWAVSGVIPSSTRRIRAQENVSSYRYLLSNF
jgi:GT2 family glycosyltransferase